MIRAGRVAAAAFAAALLLGDASSASAGKASQPPDLSGQWLLDRSRSELPGPRSGRGGWEGRRGGRAGGPGGFPGEPGGFPGGRRGGGWGRPPGGDDERGPADSARGANRPGRLPDRILVRETAGRVVMSDSAGTALVEILTDAEGGSAGEGGANAPVVHLDGTWKGDRLEVERTGPRGGTMKETYRLEDKGRTLVVEMKSESGGRRPAMTFKRVYRRVGS